MKSIKKTGAAEDNVLKKSKKFTAPQRRLWIDYNFDLLASRSFDRPYIIALDLSFTSTGFCVLSAETAELVESGLIKTATTDGTVRERLLYIASEIRKLFTKYPASIIAYEMVSVGKNFNAAKVITLVLSQMYSCISELAPDLPYVAAPSNSALKKAALGSGKGDKNLVLKAVYKRWGEDFSNDDEADAYIAARLMFELLRVAEIYKKHRAEVPDDELGTFLIALEKSRHEGINSDLEDAGIEKHIYEVCVALMFSMEQAKENDYAYYSQTIKDILQ